MSRRCWLWKSADSLQIDREPENDRCFFQTPDYSSASNSAEEARIGRLGIELGPQTISTEFWRDAPSESNNGCPGRTSAVIDGTTMPS